MTVGINCMLKITGFDIYIFVETTGSRHVIKTLVKYQCLLPVQEETMLIWSRCVLYWPWYCIFSDVIIRSFIWTFKLCSIACKFLSLNYNNLLRPLSTTFVLYYNDSETTVTYFNVGNILLRVHLIKI
jgi:hypothetical protein